MEMPKIKSVLTILEEYGALFRALDIPTKKLSKNI